jgi:hypothetical protein
MSNNSWASLFTPNRRFRLWFIGLNGGHNLYDFVPTPSIRSIPFDFVFSQIPQIFCLPNR